LPLKEGVNLIEGDLIAIGGLTIHRKPIAFIHEIIRSKIKGLNVLTFGGGPEIHPKQNINGKRYQRKAWFKNDQKSI